MLNNSSGYLKQGEVTVFLSGPVHLSRLKNPAQPLGEIIAAAREQGVLERVQVDVPTDDELFRKRYGLRRVDQKEG